VTSAGVRWFLGAFAACLSASLAVYWPALHGGYIWDDRDIYIVNNPLLRQSDGLYRFWFTTEPLDYYPLAYTVYWFGARLWGLDPFGFHLVNVVVHALSATFLAWTLQRLSFPAPALVGLLFALHPMNVESVAWIAQLKTCMAGMFAFAAAGFFLRGWNAAALLCFVLSLSSKPIAIAFPVAVLVYGWWRDGLITRSIVRRSSPFFVASLVFGAVGVYFQQANAIGPTMIRADSMLSRLLASTWAVWFYAWKGLVPVNLMFVYPRWDVAAAGMFAYVPGAALLALAAILWLKRRVWGRTPAAAVALFLLMILPSSGLVDVYYWRYAYVGDHYAYQALPVVITAAVGVGWILLRRWRTNRAGPEPMVFARLAALAVMGFLGVQSLRLSKDYKHEATLWEATLRRNPEAWLAHTNLAARLIEQDELRKAERHAIAAYRLRPDLGESHNNLGLLLSRSERHDEAVERFRAAVERSPYDHTMWGNLGVELARIGRDEEALEALRKAVEVVAETPSRGLKNVRPLCEYANQLSLMGRQDESLALFKEAAALRPDEPLVPIGIGHLHARKGDYRDAAVEYRRAVERSPGNPNALLNLARMQEKLGELDASYKNFDEAGRHGSTEALMAVVWIRAASPRPEFRDPPRALLDVERKQPVGVFAAMVHDAHAAALAANGRFADAVQANDRALAACRESRFKNLPTIKDAIGRLERRGDRYRNGRPVVGPTSELAPILSRE
jgi:tetratricopeptide (TPR) repeat protein